MKGFVTAKQAAEMIGIEHGSVLAAIRRTAEGTAKYPLKAQKFGRDWWIQEADVEAYKESERKRGRKNAVQRKNSLKQAGSDA